MVFRNDERNVPSREERSTEVSTANDNPQGAALSYRRNSRVYVSCLAIQQNEGGGKYSACTSFTVSAFWAGARRA